MTRQTHAGRQQTRKRQGEQGIVLLVVLVLILMATSTAVWALQSTLSEQRASTSVLEMSLSRAHSECAAMGGIALEELNNAGATLGAEWQAGASQATSYPNKYKWPVVPSTVGGFIRHTSQNSPDAIYACGLQMSRGNRAQHSLHESYKYDTDTTTAVITERFLVVITGFGDIKPIGAFDSDLARQTHEIDTQTRAFFDQTN
jgi:Tfp pilus assembly protein PilX